MEISGGSAIAEPEYIVHGSKGAMSCSGNSMTLRYIDPDQQLEPLEAYSCNPPLEGGFGNSEAINWINKTLEVAPSCGSRIIKHWRNNFCRFRRAKSGMVQNR